MIVTFDMKMTKIFKNALIFTVLGIKRNLMALLGIVLLTGLFILSIMFLAEILPAVFILPFLCLLGFCGFMYTYAAYPVLQRYMIDPVQKPAAQPTEGEAV